MPGFGAELHIDRGAACTHMLCSHASFTGSIVRSDRWNCRSSCRSHRKAGDITCTRLSHSGDDPFACKATCLATLCSPIREFDRPLQNHQLQSYACTKRPNILTRMKHAGRQLGAIALLALLVRVFVPDGFMLASAETAQGRYLVVKFCDGHPGATQIVDLDTGKRVDPKDLHKSPGKQDSSKQPCAFAGAPVFAAPVGAIEPINFLSPVEHIRFVEGHVRPGRGIAAPPPPATGPPGLI